MKFGIFKTLLSFVRYFHSYLLSQCIRNKTLKLCPIQIFKFILQRFVFILSKSNLSLVSFISSFWWWLLCILQQQKNIVYRLWNYNVCLAHVLWVLRAIHMQRSSWQQTPHQVIYTGLHLYLYVHCNVMQCTCNWQINLRFSPINLVRFCIRK